MPCLFLGVMGEKAQAEQGICQRMIWLICRALGVVASAPELHQMKCPEDCQTASGQL